MCCSILLMYSFSVIHNAEKIVEHCDLPEHLLTDVDGDVIFEQIQPKVWGLSQHPDKELCAVSQRLVTDEQTKFQKYSRIVMQVIVSYV